MLLVWEFYHIQFFSCTSISIWFCLSYSSGQQHGLQLFFPVLSIEQVDFQVLHIIHFRSSPQYGGLLDSFMVLFCFKFYCFLTACQFRETATSVDVETSKSSYLRYSRSLPVKHYHSQHQSGRSFFYSST
jgi:hypothetical protein